MIMDKSNHIYDFSIYFQCTQSHIHRTMLKNTNFKIKIETNRNDDAR